MSNIFILCLLLFFSFFNILKDIIILYILYNHKDSIEEKCPIIKKYPKIKRLQARIINRYEKLSILYILFEIIFMLLILLFLLVFCYIKIYSLVNMS